MAWYVMEWWSAINRPWSHNGWEDIRDMIKDEIIKQLFKAQPNNQTVDK
jgi:hypothetical protein